MNIASWYELSTSAGRASTKICSCHKWVTIEVEIKFFPRSIWVLGSWAPTRIRVPSLNWKLQVSKTSFYEVFLSYVYKKFLFRQVAFIHFVACHCFFFLEDYLLKQIWGFELFFKSCWKKHHFCWGFHRWRLEETIIAKTTQDKYQT